MSSTWITSPVRFRPDQIAAFEELYPDKQFAPVVRMLLDAFLDGKKPAKKRLDEVRKLRERAEKQALVLRAEEDQLVKEEHQNIMSEAVIAQRAQYISANPAILEEFKKHNISTAGYHKLQHDLKFTCKKQVEEYLSGLNVEVK